MHLLVFVGAILAPSNSCQIIGRRFSSGAGTRIAIARLFLKNPPIIFLDEPTASLAQIVDSDCIYVMKKGHMVEHGTHDELSDLKGTYHEIFDASARSLYSS